MNTLLPIIAAAPLLATLLPAEHLTISNESVQSATESIATADPILKVGDTIENFTIPTPLSPDGVESVDLSALLAEGPVVLTFFRGSWCPYCRTELSDIQDRLDDFSELGATVLAVSPEIDEKGIEMGKELDLGFYIGHDENNELARSLGLTFKLDAKTIKKYREYGINVPDANGTRKWELPVPATYVIDTGSTIKFVFDDENYSKRANYKKVLQVVKEITED